MAITIKQIGKGIGWVFVAIISLLIMILLYLGWYSPGKTAAITDEAGKPLARSIAEWRPLSINQSEQWLLIRGQDSTKPVLLFLHGGPGLPELSFLVGHELEKRFVVVNWEQRGSGKSYNPDLFHKGRPFPFTINTFVDDAAQVSQYLSKRFRQPKIYLIAHSWGTLLGALTVQKHPELFQAFFSISQVCRQLEAEKLSYDWVLSQARARGHDRQVNRLLEQGRPPYPPQAWGEYLGWQRLLVAEYGGGMYKQNFYPLFIRSILHCKEYTLRDKLNYGIGALKTVDALWPAVVETDLFKTTPELQVPYFLFQGTHDYQTPYVLAKQYFQTVKAPQKALFTFTNSAHSPIFEEPERFMHCLDSVSRALPR